MQIPITNIPLPNIPIPIKLHNLLTVVASCNYFTHNQHEYYILVTFLLFLVIARTQRTDIHSLFFPQMYVIIMSPAFIMC